MIRATLYFILSTVLFFFGIFLTGNLYESRHYAFSLVAFVFCGALTILTFNIAAESTEPRNF